MSANSEPLFLGIDGGGSRCRAVIINAAGERLGQGEGGSAHPARGLLDLEKAILQATRQALTAAGQADYPLAQLCAVAGLAGLHLPRFDAVVQQWQHPFAAIRFVSDLDVACYGAHRGGDGGVIIMGTGVSAHAVVAGHSLDIAGHGFPHSGKGAGHWLGYEAVSAVLAASDRLGPVTKLSGLVYDACGIAQGKPMALADHFYQAPASEFARLAPLVLSAATMGDTVAQRLRNEAIGYLNDIALQISAFGVPRLCLVGGVAEVLTPFLVSGVKRLLVAPVHTPAMGAALMARAGWQ